jgi:hypothetical protein
LQGELDCVWREEQLVDLPVYSTFAEAAADIPPTDDPLEVARSLMDSGFSLYQQKLQRKKELQLRAIALLEEIRAEREKHSAAEEFTADRDPRFDPDVDLEHTQKEGSDLRVNDDTGLKKVSVENAICKLTKSTFSMKE